MGVLVGGVLADLIGVFIPRAVPGLEYWRKCLVQQRFSLAFKCMFKEAGRYDLWWTCYTTNQLRGSSSFLSALLFGRVRGSGHSTSFRYSTPVSRLVCMKSLDHSLSAPLMNSPRVGVKTRSCIEGPYP